ncbi:MAG: cache domain-containing protein, partial [Nitrospinae bacterium]|nr:cache domain-containing protein [Nitrospinota bacterium]
MPRTGLKTKLIALVIGVGTIPLVLAMILSYVQGNKSLINVIGSSFKALAYESAAKIDFLIEAEINKNSHLTNHPTLILAVKFQNKRFEDIHPSEVKNHFAEQSLLWQKEDPRMQPFLANASSRILKTFLHQRSQSNLATTSLYLTDSKGLLVASTNFYPDFVDADHPAQKFLKDNSAAVFIGQLHHSQKTNKYVFEMVLPIKSPEGEIIGLFHRAYSAKDFFKPSIESIIFGETGRVMLIDSDGVVIDCPILPTGTKLEDPELVRSVTSQRTPPSHPNWALQGKPRDRQHRTPLFIAFLCADLRPVLALKTT